MSVYLAKKTPNPKDSPQNFLAKKLGGYAPSPISLLSIFGRARFPEAAYGMYRTFIDAFCYATAISKPVFAQAEGFSDLYLAETTLPVPIPPLLLAPAMALTEDQAESFLKKLPNGTSMKAIGKKYEYVIPKPSIADLPKYLAAANPVVNAGPDRLTPAGLKAYQKALSVLEVFLATNTYPAFKDLDSEVPIGQSMTFGVTGHNGENGKDYFYTYSSEKKRSAKEITDHNSVLKRRKIEEGEGSQVGDMEVDETTEEVLMDGAKNASFRLSDPWIHTSVVTAKPSTAKASINFGPPGSCPNHPGLVFPYFKGMCRPDFHLVYEIMVNSFFRLFGKDSDAAKKEISEMSRGFNSLMNTETGTIIGHMFKGVALALQTQTRLFLLIEDGYKGFVLFGGHFSIYDGSKWVVPVSNDLLKVEFGKMDTHTLNVAFIAETLSKLKVGEGAPSPVSASALDSSAAIIAEMSIRDFGSLEDTDDLDAALRGLIWPKPFSQLSPSSFLQFLEMYFHSVEPPPIDMPMYIPSSKAPIKSRLFKCLSTFGPDAPSLWNSRKSEVISALPPKAQKGDKDSDEKKAAPPKEIIILPKPLIQAVADWEKIISKGSVSFNFKERAKDYRAHVVRDDDMRVKLWDSLSKGLAAAEKKVEGEPEKKRAKTVEGSVATADALLSLF